MIVADADIAQAEAAAAFLARHGFEARAFDDGGEAIVTAEAWPADAAVLSVPLASVSGIEVARHLRQSFGPSFRLIARSSGSDGAARRLMDAGFDTIVASEAAEPQRVLAALGDATRPMVVRSMQQTVRRIELLVVLGHSLLGSRQRQPSGVNVERVSRIVKLVRHDIAELDLPRERERLHRELQALAERIPDERITRF